MRAPTVTRSGLTPRSQSAADPSPQVVHLRGAVPGPGRALLVALLLGIALQLALQPRPAFADPFRVSQTRSVTTGTAPNSVASADLNGDGILDLAVANAVSNTVSVLLGTGAGGYSPKSDFATGPGTFSVAIGDVNGDGKPDLAVTNLTASTVSVLLGTGTGSFGPKTDFATGASPRTVAIGDVDGDGRPDLAVANQGSNTVSVLLGTGAGSFGPKTDFATGTLPFSVAIADLNGDARPDLLTANYSSNTVSVLLGTGAGNFGARTDLPVGANPTGVAAGDLNGDDWPDVAVSNGSSNTVSVLLNDGAGNLGPKTDYATGSFPTSVAIGFVSLDLEPDLVVTNYGANTISVLPGSGSGDFGSKTDFATGSNPTTAAVGDLNGDGVPDVAVANYGGGAGNSVSVLLGFWDYPFSSRTDWSTGAGPASVAIGDVDGDGKPDLAVANFNQNNVYVMLGNGEGGIRATNAFATGSLPNSVAIGDLNSDGKPDLVVANAGTSFVSVMLGLGTGLFYAKTDFATGNGPYSVAIGDVNGDSRLDVVTANYSSNTVSVLLGTGTGSFGAKTDFATSSGPRFVVLSDLNGDGKLDLAVTNLIANSVSVLLGTGTGSFATKTDFPTGLYPASMAIADVNGDGRPDLVTTNGSSNTVSVLPGTGTGSFGANTDFATGGSPRGVAMDDLNGDGRLDLAVANGSDGTVSLLLGDGAGSFAPRIDFPTGPGSAPGAVAIVDLNCDGVLDLAVANWNVYSVSVLLGAGKTRTTLSVSPATAVQGSQVTLTASVAFNSKTTRVPSPNYVHLLDGFNWLGSPNIGWSAVQDFDGAFGTKSEFTTGAAPYSVAIGDVNGDGQADQVVPNSSSSTVSVLLGSGTGSFLRKIDLATGATPLSAAIGDLNGDGWADLAVANNASSTVSVLLGTGTGTFGAKTDFPTGLGPVSVVIGDVNRDGKLDLAVLNSPASTVSVLLGTGTGSFGANTDFATGSLPRSLAVGDVNADGKPDLVSANSGGGSGNTVSVLLGTGTGSFGAKTDLITGVGPRSVLVADLNRDGRSDLVTANSTSGTVSVLFGAGAGNFGPNDEFYCGSDPRSVAIGDVNSDGWPDLVTANHSGPQGNAISELLGNGGSFYQASLFPTGAGPNSVAVADVNNDGTPDLVTANYGGGSGSTVSVLLGKNRTTWTGTATLATTVNRLGAHLLSGLFQSDDLRLRSLSAGVMLQVVSTAAAATRTIKDVGNDQGKQVRLTFGPSLLDVAGSSLPITQYEVYRQVDPALAPALAAGITRLAGGDAAKPALPPASAQLAGWDYLGAIAAHADTVYTLVVPTLADSSTAGIHRATFMVRAATASPAVYYDSAPDSGYSVDNLAPLAPTPFTAAYVSGATNLHWGANSEPDFSYYKVYRGSSAGFVPDAGSRIASQSDTGYVDVGPAGSYYKLSAVDVNGNESAYVLLAPSGTTGVDDGPVAFALGRPANPVVGGRLTVRFALPSAEHATLEIVDVSGRAVARLDVGVMGAGRHALTLGEGAPLAAGIYFVRLKQGQQSAMVRVTVLR